jgi:hypothetical protein
MGVDWLVCEHCTRVYPGNGPCQTFFLRNLNQAEYVVCGRCINEVQGLLQLVVPEDDDDDDEEERDWDVTPAFVQEVVSRLEGRMADMQALCDFYESALPAAPQAATAIEPPDLGTPDTHALGDHSPEKK